jgi:peptide-methionine (R)-S-oxide reductase
MSERKIETVTASTAPTPMPTTEIKSVESTGEEEFAVWLSSNSESKLGSNSKADWKTLLTPNEYDILRQSATDPADMRAEATTGTPTSGLFVCKACYKTKYLTPLYSAHAKFRAHCGWPAFDQCFAGAVVERPDPDGTRVEMVCGACLGHLGHVFRGETYTSTNTRHCVNAPTIKFLPTLSKRLFAALSASSDPEAAAVCANTSLSTPPVVPVDGSLQP